MNGKCSSFLVVGTTLLVMGVLLFPVDALAQERKVKFGGKAGFNLSRMRGDATEDAGTTEFDTGNGFSLGGLLAVDVHPNVTFQPELLYSRKKVEVSEGGFTGEIETDSIEIPLIAKLHASDEQPIRFFALGGATLSFPTSAEETVLVDGMTEVEDVKDALTSATIGLTVGGGVDFARDWGVVTVDARYTFGLSDFNDNAGDDEALKQDTFSVSGGIIF